MKHLLKILAAGFALTGPAQTALAADMSACQILILETLEVEDIAGEAQIASYFPATDFINSAQDDIPGHLSDVNGQKIRALMCTRNDIIPAETDYALLATGVPFVVSQDFDSMDTDSLTVKWIEGHFKYAYKGQPLSDEAVTLLKTRLAQFSERGLTAAAVTAAEIEAQAKRMKEQIAETETVPVKRFKDRNQTDIVQTTLAVPSDNRARDEFSATDAEEIMSEKIDLSEATQLHIQTQN